MSKIPCFPKISSFLNPLEMLGILLWATTGVSLAWEKWWIKSERVGKGHKERFQKPKNMTNNVLKDEGEVDKDHVQ